MGVRKWLEKSAEKQKHKLRKTLNPLSRKAFQAVSFSAAKDTEKRLFSQENAVFLNFLAQIKCHAEHLTTYRLLALFWYFENNHRTNVANIVEV